MSISTISLDHLRTYAVTRSLFTPTSLKKALQRLSFVQADPLRAPAKAQDLTLRNRVTDYRVGDLELRYPKLPIEEDFFVNYGFVASNLHHLMHPRTPRNVWTYEKNKQALEIMDFVRDVGIVKPSEVDAHFDLGRVTNWFGGNSKASTQLLDEMHYRGMLRVARRVGGQRHYELRVHEPSDIDPLIIMDKLIDVIVSKYAPLPSASLGQLVGLLGGGVPQWRQHRNSMLIRAKKRLPNTLISGTTWYWPEGENPISNRYSVADEVRILSPFDPVVWDRKRFEHFWGWSYRFEAYTPAAKRIRGHYAMPLLWRDKVIGWANLSTKSGTLIPELGFVDSAPKEKSFRRALEDDLHRLSVFLKL